MARFLLIGLVCLLYLEYPSFIHAQNPFPYLKSATIYISVNDWADIWLNGIPIVENQRYTPETVLINGKEETGVYQIIKCRPQHLCYFKKENLLAIENTKANKFPLSPNNRIGVAYILRLRFSDGTQLTLSSDDFPNHKAYYLPDWRMAEPPHWHQIYFDDSNWKSAYSTGSKVPFTAQVIDPENHHEIQFLSAFSVDSIAYHPGERHLYRRKFFMNISENPLCVHPNTSVPVFSQNFSSQPIWQPQPTQPLISEGTIMAPRLLVTPIQVIKSPSPVNQNPPLVIQKESQISQSEGPRHIPPPPLANYHAQIKPTSSPHTQTTLSSPASRIKPTIPIRIKLRPTSTPVLKNDWIPTATLVRISKIEPIRLIPFTPVPMQKASSILIIKPKLTRDATLSKVIWTPINGLENKSNANLKPVRKVPIRIKPTPTLSFGAIVTVEPFIRSEPSAVVRWLVPTATPGFTPIPTPTQGQTIIFEDGMANIYITFGDGAGNYQLIILDQSGKLLKTLFDDWEVSGDKWVDWDGTDFQGNKLPPGWYWVIFSKDGRKLNTMDLLKNRQ